MSGAVDQSYNTGDQLVVKSKGGEVESDYCMVPRGQLDRSLLGFYQRRRGNTVGYSRLTATIMTAECQYTLPTLIPFYSIEQKKRKMWESAMALQLTNH